MRRILEDSDGEDDFIDQMDDLAIQDSMAEEFLGSDTYDANDDFLTMEEDVITIQQFIDDTNPGDVNAHAFNPGTNSVSPDTTPFVPDDNSTVSASNLVALADNPIAPAVPPLARLAPPVQLPTTWKNTIRELPREVFTGYDEGKRQDRVFTENCDLWTIFCEIIE